MIRTLLNIFSPALRSPAGKKAAVFLGGLVLTLLAAELFLRLDAAASRYLQERRNSISLSRNGGGYRIMCLGESTTAGGDSAWPARLERLLNERYPGAAFSVVNKGVPGVNLDQLLAPLEKDLDEVRPDLVITMMGINDGFIRYYGGISGVNGFLFRHVRLYRWFRLALKLSKTAQFRTLTVPPPFPRPDPAQADPYIPFQSRYRYGADEERELLKKIETGPADFVSMYLLGRFWTQPGPRSGAKDLEKERRGEALLLQAARLAPKKAYIFEYLGMYYRLSGRAGQGAGMLEKAVAIQPSAQGWYFLGRACLDAGLAEKAEAAFGKAAFTDGFYEDAALALYRLYSGQGAYTKAEELLKRCLDLQPENEKLLSAMEELCRKAGRPEQAAAYAQRLEAVRTLFTGRTREHYGRLRSLLAARGIRLACMQYPMCPLAPLKTLLGDAPEVIFIDNEKTFEKAVAQKGPAYYFLDLFAGNFGHCTPAGDELIARNAADALAGYFGKPPAR